MNNPPFDINDKIKSVNSSCAIEANTLTEKEVEDILNGKRIITPPKEIVEVKNTYNACVNYLAHKGQGFQSSSEHSAIP